jgi:exodeoxyribonuclease VII small subunit
LTRQKSATPDFEAALAELEQIVERLEQGELSLEESLRQFERPDGETIEPFVPPAAD